MVSQECSVALEVWGYGAGIARQSSDVMLDGPVGAGEWYGID